MRKAISITLIIISGFLFQCCSKKIVPGLKPEKEYNLSGYKYLFVEGIKQKLLGNHGEALSIFEQCLLINPESDAAYYQMAQIVLSRGDMVNGKKYLVKAKSIQPENLWYNMLLAGIYHQQNNIDSTIICYEKASRLSPDKEDLMISLARLYSQNKEYAKAGNILKKFDEKYGVNEKTTLLLVENLMAEGRKKEALDKIKLLLAQDPDDIIFNGYLAEIYRSGGETDKARNVYNELIERNPENPGIQLSICDFLLKEKNYDELFDMINVVIINDRITREEKISLISELIADEEIIKNYDNKLELAVMILEANIPDDDIILLLRPDLLQKSGKAEEAAQRLEEIIKENPDNYYAWEKLLLIYYELRNFKNLQSRGEESATKFNRSIMAKIMYAAGAMENQNYDIAIEELRKAEILAGDNKAMKLQVQTMRADIYYRMNNYTDAFNAFDEALKLDNGDLTVMNNYAYYLAEQGMNLKEAERMARFVIDNEPYNNTFLDTYAWVLYKRGKAREASRIMEKIIESDDNGDAEYYEHYGFILKKLGKCREAIINWGRAITLDESKVNLKIEIENCGK